ncbi:MAG: uridine kinase [Nitrospirae bacterium]|nr:uridine kinase [Nitrospirota bacterium]
MLKGNILGRINGIKQGFIIVFFFKLVLLLIFSSDFQNKLFMPFVQHFLANGGNPWQYFYETSNKPDIFPYHPLMLYIFSFFYYPARFFSEGPVILQNLFFKLPILIVDIAITILLLKTFPNKQREIFIFYFISPIIIYASYMHSQLDLIPTALLFFSVYFLSNKKNVIISAVFFGLAISTKLHVLAALPLIVIYLLRNQKTKGIPVFTAISALVYIFFVLPYIGSEGFKHLVLSNPKQMLLFDVTYKIGGLTVFLPVWGAFLLYIRFLIYGKINLDLFYTFIVILFSVFVLLVPPSPAWYVWMFPFLSIFFIKFFSKNTKIIYYYAALNLFYILFFVCFNLSGYQDLTFLNTGLDLKIYDWKLSSMVFTALEAILFGVVYLFYKFGVKSNAVYKRDKAILIGIGGDSAAGKTTVLSDIEMLLGNRLFKIEGDADHKWERGDQKWQKFTHLNPKANYLHGQAESLILLKAGHPVFRRDYDHRIGKFTEPVKMYSKDFIAISGLHPFYLPVMRKIIDLKIYLDTDERLRRHWKILRDTKERGYSAASLLEQIEKRAEDAGKYIYPQKRFADISINYFTDENFAVGDEACSPPVKLKITLNADMHLARIIDQFSIRGVDISWDYSDDLHTQYLVIEKQVSKEILSEIAREVIENIEEIIADKMQWRDGHRGFVQLIILLCLSKEMKAYGDEVQGHFA